MTLTPEEHEALERLRNPPEDYTATQQNRDYLTCVVIALREHPADGQPVDWPYEPGLWWMDSTQDKYPWLVEFDHNHPGKLWLDGGGHVTDKMAKDCSARFLPAHIPTFPPREDK